MQIVQKEFVIKTNKREEIIDITEEVKAAINKTKIKEGICVVYVPHATAALTINENTDPSVSLDLLEALAKLAPRGKWRHDKIDNNADAHIKSAIVGSSVTIPINNSALTLGTWQGIMLCEFDGPKERKIIVKIIGN